MKPKIFIGSSTEHLKPAYAIQQNLANDAEIVVWPQGIFDITGGILDEILKVVNTCDFGVFVFAADDSLTIRTQDFTAVRDNVVFEYGLFLGRLGRSRSFFIVPKDADKLWLPTDLSGIVRTTYPANAPNLQAALGPACAQIRNKIEELGVRTARFRQESVDAEIDTSSGRFRALTGDWVGHMDQRTSNGPHAGKAPITLTLTATSEGLIAEGFFDFPGLARVPLKATGSFYHNQFLKMDYVNADKKVMQFGCGILELDAPGNILRGEYVGYGAWNDAVVAGTIHIERKVV